MKKIKKIISKSPLPEADILAAYINKMAASKRADVRLIRRELRKLQIDTTPLWHSKRLTK